MSVKIQRKTFQSDGVLNSVRLLLPLDRLIACGIQNFRPHRQTRGERIAGFGKQNRARRENGRRRIELNVPEKYAKIKSTNQSLQRNKAGQEERRRV